MKYFQNIPKEWKEQGKVDTCQRCGVVIDRETDYFSVSAYWKIKNAPDQYLFCSLGCMEAWAGEDSLVSAE